MGYLNAETRRGAFLRNELIFMPKKLISIIIPIYNEEKNIPLIYAETKKVLGGLKDKYDYEIIFIDDGSEDYSIWVLKKLAFMDDKIKYLQFSKNFGKEIATSAGINNSRGDAVIMLDADLQHPPELIREFLEKWENGAEIVVGIRNKNKGEGLIKKFGSFLFYKIINLISVTRIVPQSTDYRLLDRVVADEFNRFTERSRMTRGLIDWLGFRRDYVYFDAEQRINGNAGYSTLKLIKLALSGFISLSLFPLKFAGYLGIAIVLFSWPLGIFIFVEKYILNDPWGMSFSGPAILAVIILFLIGIVLICMGLMALYIGNIQNEVMNRPMYVVRSKKLES